MKRILSFGIAILLSFTGFAQVDQSVKKSINIFPLVSPIAIDGIIDETTWFKALKADDFVQNDPNPGSKPVHQTEVRITYDNSALYVAATMFDNQPDSILKQLTERDERGVTDYFGFIIDSYKDGNNGVGFFVTAAGTQIDIKYASGIDNNCDGTNIFCGDRNWDAVWSSKVKINTNSWTAEFKIPFSALRFPEKDIQNWNINFNRMVRRIRTQSSWNEIHPEGTGFLFQTGEITGLKNIKPPLRLSATPYLASYISNHYDSDESPAQNWSRSINGGMDIKYGINEAFTLDMTLIPDFGETRSDDQILNLSPFEVRFDENRQFFTEGVELFNKGNLFYSRRIGGRPLRYWDVEDNLAEDEEIVDNPIKTQLYNATKVSGRTEKGLGIGVFNATSQKMHARIKNGEGDSRIFETAPLTNYNVVVFDQNLPNNSYATFINTNVMRNGEYHDANVTGTLFNLRNKNNSYELHGKGVLSQIFENGEIDLGHSYSLNLGKTSGKVRWETGYYVENDTYDPNDLGFLYNNNERTWHGEFNYAHYQPFGIFNRAGGRLRTKYSRLHAPNEFNRFSIESKGWAMTKKRNAFGFSTYHEPVNKRDFFEPRTEDFSLFLEIPTNHNYQMWYSSDYTKRFAFDIRSNFRKFNSEGRHRFNINFEPRIRVNDRINIIAEIENYNSFKDIGYVNTLDNGDVIMGDRDQITVINSIQTGYSFNNKMNISFRLRHYWAKVEYLGFSSLNRDGTLSPSDYQGNHNNNFNAFNIDAVYRWRFAPGSDIFIVWKNAILGEEDFVAENYLNNLEESLFHNPQTNTLSVKVIYYLDYLNLRG